MGAKDRRSTKKENVAISCKFFNSLSQCFCTHDIFPLRTTIRKLGTTAFVNTSWIHYVLKNIHETDFHMGIPKVTEICQVYKYSEVSRKASHPVYHMLHNSCAKSVPLISSMTKRNED